MRVMAMKVGNAIRKGLAIDWHDRDGGWTKYMRLGRIVQIG
ncbi:hypothetical protein GOBAR_AA11188 [Gossypium barbadense]|uniref:Uncharacterized protein n=1 Tax=Gossypium barbadense TaxID=3634 RepID=A0A2P5Y1K0_GOSBA|nr:hypothetical protein GOBAR_AA11188 [Gossypium barbadense]